MRLLITQETDWLKRNPHQQHHLAEMLSLRGHEVRVIDFELLWREEKGKGLYTRRTVIPGVSKIHAGAGVTLVRPGILRLPWLDYASMAFTHRSEIQRQMVEFAPQAIIGLGIINSYLAAWAARGAGIPFLYYWIDVLHRLIPSRLLRPIGRRVEEAALKRADVVITINERLREYVMEHGANAGKTAVIGAGIDIKRYDPASSKGHDTRKQLGMADGDTVLFFMGWLYTFSGLEEVALQLARRQNPNIKLLVVGEGDAYEALRQIRDKYDLRDRLILVGKKPYQAIPAFVAAADICLLPAYPDEDIMQDIVPIKMYEYMAMKKPVIATRLPGVVREFGENNGVVYVDRPEDVIAKAGELVQNCSVDGLGLRARRFAEGNSWDRITDEFERVMEEVIQERQNERTSK